MGDEGGEGPVFELVWRPMKEGRCLARRASWGFGGDRSSSLLCSSIVSGGGGGGRPDISAAFAASSVARLMVLRSRASSSKVRRVGGHFGFPVVVQTRAAFFTGVGRHIETQ